MVCVDGLPFDCLLGQHAVSSQECEGADNGQIFKSLEHVEVCPIDIHQTKHGWKKIHRLSFSISNNHCLGFLATDKLNRSETLDDKINQLFSEQDKPM